MKSLLLICLITLTALTTQSQNIEGTYANKWVSPSGEGVEYSLTLNDGGEFIFNHKRIYSDDSANAVVAVTGSWTLENNLLVLKTDSSDTTDNEIVAALNANKARFVTVSPRNPNFNMIKPSLKFYESDIFYAKNMELLKTETNSTVSR